MAAKNCNIDYFWRNYNGEIPADAYSPGIDEKGVITYIGQAFIEERPGVYPTAIRPGKPIITSIDGPREVSNFVQILCTKHAGCFKWLQTDATNLHKVTKNHHPIIAGIEEGGHLYIGKLTKDGEMIIGKILAGHTFNAMMWFPHKNCEHCASSFEVLIFDSDNFENVDLK
ncbi:uncharacterized protein LOC115889314 [Sitophilus oryzae]|uniref:Uncharacterized protein LOC115889314 n=1 Tax=Sitophilus oryzae TaxID=7048 RepID=A0A6J2YPD2_SITOR|nr:uncharacterized protein LOC115889314 [Sitophilus oryzae]